jgi:tRNA nucleotidyltransferase (CCA-adding enzyme)
MPKRTVNRYIFPPCFSSPFAPRPSFVILECMNAEVLRISRAVRQAGGRAMLVGGSVRDLLLGIQSTHSKDFDLEVYGVAPDRLRSILESIAPVNAVGEQFTVYKLAFQALPEGKTEERPEDGAVSERGSSRLEIDVSIPRRESKSGRGHRGFIIEGDPGMSFEDAARRRDFTLNAVLLDPLSGEMIDPFGGMDDLKNRILRAVAGDTFVEDSLRVLRAVQLAARFEMSIEPRTVELCRSIDLADLPAERIWGEFEKLLMLAARPSIGLDAARELLVLDKLFPDIAATIGCPQEPEWHPEGDVFTHTKLCMDEAVKLVGDLDKPRRITVMLAVLLHDLGKPLTTKIIDGRIRSMSHDEEGVEPARRVLNTLGLHTLGGYDVRSQVLALVFDHLRPGQFHRDGERVTPGAFRRLARRVNMNLLYRVAKADSLGRGAASTSVSQEWFLERAREIGVEHGAPAALLQGRHLIEAGFEPGPRMGELLRRVYELQLDGKVTTVEEALDAAKRIE